MAANNGRQILIKARSTATPPHQIIIKSALVIARISPNRNPIKSTLTQVMKAKTTNPTASAECASSPSKASDDRLARRCKSINNIATTTEIQKTVKVIFNSSSNASATPSKAECESVSPKYASLRQITKQPSGPATTATPIPPTMARMKKSSSIFSLSKGAVFLTIVLF